MLETKLQSAERVPRSAASARPSARLSSSYASSATARVLPNGLPSTDRAAAVRTLEREARSVSGGYTQNRRLTRSEARLLTWTVTFAVAVCGLLVVYLAAYAHVTLLGIDQSEMRTNLHEKRLENQMLRAELASLKSPDRISAKATALGLTKESRRVDYITPPQSAGVTAFAPDTLRSVALPETFSDNGVTTKVGGEAGSQGTESGSTTDDTAATGHD